MAKTYYLGEGLYADTLVCLYSLRTVEPFKQDLK
jgi:hypothetical protein